MRIVWASISVVMFVAFLVGFSTSDGSGGFAIHVFGATIPQNLLASMSDLADPIQFIRSFLRTLIVWVVPFTFFVTAYFPLVEAIESDKLKGFFLGTILGAANGFFYSQLLIMPIWAICVRIMGSMIPASLALADLHALVLGVQLLVWGIIFNRLIRSNRGIAMVLTFGLSAIGTKLSYLLDFGEVFGMSSSQIKIVDFFYHFLPSEHIADTSIALSTLIYGVCGALLIAALLVILPLGKKSKATG
ncbi:MAG: hypothetical protein FWG02_05350 [Holophagaceae bacterium]|nr:hypothetical protein [Holophagaceae bacterium]